MGLTPWETSDGQLFALITGANSGLGFGIASRLIDEFFTSPDTSPNKHLVLIVCTRSAMKTRFTISRLRAHARRLFEVTPFAKALSAKAKAQGIEYKWEEMVNRVHFLGVEVDLCDLKSVYALADRLVNGTVGSPDATTMAGQALPHGSPGTQAFSKDLKQDPWALSQAPGSTGAQRSWGWGLSGIRIPRLDVVIWCAAIGNWIGLDWGKLIKSIVTDLTETTTWPDYKLAKVGSLVKSLSSSNAPTSSDEATKPLLSEKDPSDEPPLGEVFSANVFGQYVLSHELMPLLSRPSSSLAKTGGKIIWVSSIDAMQNHFSIDDIQALKSPAPYESSKRLIDLLALTSNLPSVQRISASFYECKNNGSNSNASEDEKNVQLLKPTIYLSHPGVFVSEIMPLNFIVTAIYTLLFYIVRWMGSPWHLVVAYKAAVAPVWLALTSDEALESMEGRKDGKAKWGSAINVSGDERVMRTEVPGWGWDGKLGSVASMEKMGRKKNALDLTPDAREDFEVLGAKAWKEMEDIRREWEGIYGRGKRN